MTACDLPYHRPGSSVAWTSALDGNVTTLTGEVLAHNPDHHMIRILCDQDLEYKRISCGGVARKADR